MPDYSSFIIPEIRITPIAVFGQVRQPLQILIFVLGIAASSSALAAEKWTSLFDGKTLKGWYGDPKFWTIQDGALTGTTTKDNPTRGNTFLIYTGDNADNSPVEFGDFELKFKYRVTGHNSGMQYRSFIVPEERDGWRVGGYQADMDAANEMAGAIYGERFRRMLSGQGEKSTVTGVEDTTLPNGRTVETAVRTVEVLADREELKKALKTALEWNEMHIIARGHHFVQKINGVTISELIDKDQANRRSEGLIAIQLHGGPPMTAQVRDIRIREVNGDSTVAAATGAKAHWPEFSWDRIWPAASVANTLKDGRFTEDELQRLAKFPIVKLVCTRRNNDWNQLEAEARGRLKQLRPGICLLEYQNSVALGDIGDQGRFAGDDWKFVLPSGEILTDPKRPDEYITPDFRKPRVRDLAVEEMRKKLNEPHIDGIFIDALVGGYSSRPNMMRRAGVPEAEIEAWIAGYEDTLARGGEAARSMGKLYVANLLRAKNFPDSGLGILKKGWFHGSYLENMVYEDPELQARIIDATIEAGEAGYLLVLNPDREVTEKLSKDKLDYAKAMFLISMSENSYLMYGVWGNIRLNKWQQPFDFVDEPKKLGRPLGPPKKQGFVYTRSFEHVDVRLDVANRSARLTWK